MKELKKPSKMSKFCPKKKNNSINAILEKIRKNRAKIGHSGQF